MCGICGQFNFLNLNPVRSQDLKRMTASLAHRGPDDEGFYFSDHLGLGFRRLSVIDLEGGQQPMSDSDGTVWVLLNGEIYNFQELRAELEGYGHLFRTKSDTEVIVHGYKQWGKDVLNHLNGMFGTAIWDKRKQQLILARDRMGIKLVYYRLESGRLLFASEIRAVLAFDQSEPELDPSAASLFLRYRYTPSPLTIFRGIRKLAPGTRLIIGRDGPPRLERWWKYRPVPFDPMPTVSQAEEKLTSLYRNAIKRQLISDVPLGLLLSGGMDSGLLLALMKEHGNDWKTYTVGYGDRFKDDELSDAAKTAKVLNSANVQVKISPLEFEDSLAKVISALEEPIAASSMVPMYHVCQRARQDVTVALMGQGPDEFFGGYRRHLGVRYGFLWRSFPRRFRQLMEFLLSRLPHSESIGRGMYSLDYPDRMGRYQRVFSLLPGEAISRLFKEEIQHLGADELIRHSWADLIPLMDQTDELGGLQFLEIRSSLPDELLVYADKLSMAHGLELRVPFLDHEIVEYVERLSASFKVRYGHGKWLHKRVCRKFLPRDIVRRKKRGFAVNVVDDWFRHSLSAKMSNILRDSDSLIYKYLRPAETQQLLVQHQSGYRDNHKVLFSLVVLEETLKSCRC